MKITLATVASLVVGLTDATMIVKAEAGLTATEARLQVDGLAYAPTKTELEILDQVVLDSLNSAYENQETIKFESKETLALNLDNDSATTMIISEFVTQGGGACRYCPGGGYDDWECYIDPNCGRLEGVSEEEMLARQAGKIHFDFEKKACKKLRKSGVANFAKVDNCSFSFVETPGDVSARVNEEDAYESGKAADAEVSFRGVPRELTFPQVKFLESVILQAHADAFHQTGYELVGLDIKTFVQAGDKNWMGFARAVPTAAETADMVAPSVLVHLHDTFESAVCHELQNSGHSVFAAVDDCRFRFVYNPVHVAKASIVAASA